MVPVMAITSHAPGALTLPFDKFWNWLQAHANCILRAGTPDVLLFDHDDYHWHLANEDEMTLLIQLVRGKELVAEMVLLGNEVAYVECNNVETEEFLFECVVETPAGREVVYYFAMAHEFAIIEQYFANLGARAATTALAVGDDAAVVEVPAGQQLVVSMDTLIGGTHFALDANPADIAYKALAVNVSDLAAMGAVPAWFLLSLSLADNDDRWLSRFADGLGQAAERFGLQLIGGDTCRGALSITIQAAGHVARDRYVTRAGARAGDIVLVSGELGNAALGLACANREIDLPQTLRAKCSLALDRPRPRLELGNFLRDFAAAAIDISDGLVGDLRHILDASACGATVSRAALPVNDWIRQHDAYSYACDGGDDYEICCCVPARHRAEIDAWNREHGDCRLTPIGEITASGYFLQDGEHRVDLSQQRGYRHFD